MDKFRPCPPTTNGGRVAAVIKHSEFSHPVPNDSANSAHLPAPKKIHPVECKDLFFLHVRPNFIPTSRVSPSHTVPYYPILSHTVPQALAFAMQLGKISKTKACSSHSGAWHGCGSGYLLQLKNWMGLQITCGGCLNICRGAQTCSCEFIFRGCMTRLQAPAYFIY